MEFLLRGEKKSSGVNETKQFFVATPCFICIFIKNRLFSSQGCLLKDEFNFNIKVSIIRGLIVTTRQKNLKTVFSKNKRMGCEDPGSS